VGSEGLAPGLLVDPEGDYVRTSQDDETRLRGQARFRAPDLLEVGGEDIQAKRIIVATGSRARVPDGWEALGTRLLTPDSLFERQDLPGTEDDLSTLLCTVNARTLTKRQETPVPYNAH